MLEILFVKGAKFQQGQWQRLGGYVIYFAAAFGFGKNQAVWIASNLFDRFGPQLVSPLDLHRPETVFLFVYINVKKDAEAGGAIAGLKKQRNSLR